MFFSYPHFDEIFFTLFSKGLTQRNLVRIAIDKIQRKVRQFIQGRLPGNYLGTGWHIRDGGRSENLG